MISVERKPIVRGYSEAKSKSMNYPLQTPLLRWPRTYEWVRILQIHRTIRMINDLRTELVLFRVGSQRVVANEGAFNLALVHCGDLTVVHTFWKLVWTIYVV